jgi:hypothetical protein
LAEYPDSTGWKTTQMVERYAHLSPDSLEIAAARLNQVVTSYVLATVANSTSKEVNVSS